MNGFYWSLIWVFIWIFGSINLQKYFPMHVGFWYFCGTFLGMLLIIGFNILDAKKEQNEN